jgi:hypothetical protein
MTYAEWLASTGKPNTRESLAEWSALSERAVGDWDPTASVEADPTEAARAGIEAELGRFEEFVEDPAAVVEEQIRKTREALAEIPKAGLSLLAVLKWVMIGAVAVAGLVAVTTTVRAIRG